MGNIMKSIGSIFMPKVPKVNVPTPPAMPDPEAPGLKIAARKQVEERRKRGRAGTIYTGTGAPNTYTNQNLGGTQ